MTERLPDDPDALAALAELFAERVAPTTRMTLVDARAAARQLGVPPSWLLSEARSNRVPHVRLGKYVRFDPSDLATWTRAQARGPRRDAT